MKQNILGYWIYNRSVGDCAEEMVKASVSGKKSCKTMACLNPHSYVVAKDDCSFSKALKGADWLLPDGAGLVLAARILKRPLAGRISGPDVFEAALKLQNESGGSVFFLGASEGTLNAICERVKREFPNLSIAGTYSPPFRRQFSPEDNIQMVKAVNDASPDLLWVGMSAPKQEKWLSEHRGLLNVGAAGAIGAAFDFFAGTVNRSHPVFQRLGLEWLPRLLRQPTRLWKRTFISAPVFFVEVVREKIGFGEFNVGDTNTRAK